MYLFKSIMQPSTDSSVYRITVERKREREREREEMLMKLLSLVKNRDVYDFGTCSLINNRILLHI